MKETELLWPLSFVNPLWQKSSKIRLNFTFFLFCFFCKNWFYWILALVLFFFFFNFPCLNGVTWTWCVSCGQWGRVIGPMRSNPHAQPAGSPQPTGQALHVRWGWDGAGFGGDRHPIRTAGMITVFASAFVCVTCQHPFLSPWLGQSFRLGCACLQRCLISEVFFFPRLARFFLFLEG